MKYEGPGTNVDKTTHFLKILVEEAIHDRIGDDSRHGHQVKEGIDKQHYQVIRS